MSRPDLQLAKAALNLSVHFRAFPQGVGFRTAQGDDDFKLVAEGRMKVLRDFASVAPPSLAALSSRPSSSQRCPLGVPRGKLYAPDFLEFLPFTKKLAPRDGFEPSTNRLTAGCSTAELPGNSVQAPLPIANRFGYCKGTIGNFAMR